MRTMTAYLIAPALVATGFRFSKNFRWGTTLSHRVVYALVWTTFANQLADMIRPLARV